jgi:hypothetical protein
MLRYAQHDNCQESPAPLSAGAGAVADAPIGECVGRDTDAHLQARAELNARASSQPSDYFFKSATAACAAASRATGTRKGEQLT